MVENSLSLQQQTEISDPEVQPCFICQKREGDYLFFHKPTQHYFHKKCFEDYTCRHSPSSLCE